MIICEFLNCGYFLIPDSRCHENVMFISSCRSFRLVFVGVISDQHMTLSRVLSKQYRDMMFCCFFKPYRPTLQEIPIRPLSKRSRLSKCAETSYYQFCSSLTEMYFYLYVHKKGSYLRLHWKKSRYGALAIDSVEKNRKNRLKST